MKRRIFHRIDLIPVFAILCFAVWPAVPSSIFLRPVSWTIDGETIRFVRETPFGDVTADWTAEIRLIDGDGFECHGDGRAYYQVEPTNAITYKIGEWARNCITAGPPFTIRLSWQVLLFDVIPLRKTSTTLVVEGLREGRAASPAIGERQ